LLGRSFSRVRPEDTQEHVNTIHSSYETERQDNQPEIIVRAELHTAEHVERQRTENENRNYRLQKFLVVGTWLAFFAAAIYVGINVKIWQEMQKQTRIQRKTAINAERAWVGLDAPVKIDALEIVPRLKVESHYSIRNFGHGPALKVVQTGWFWIDPKTLDSLAKGACESSVHFATGTVPLGPGLTNPGPMGYTLFPNQPHDESIGTPSDPWQGDAQPDLKHFWFIGCTAYVDQFKITRWTRFCMEPDIYARHPMNKDIPLKFCALYNDTSDSEDPKQD
jgi:hypothetical protein